LKIVSSPIRMIWPIRGQDRGGSAGGAVGTGGAVGGYQRHPVNKIEVIGLNRTKVVLLVVPARTNPDHTHDILMAAAAPKNASTIDGLLHD
jgi:hypothetical protein